MMRVLPIPEVNSSRKWFPRLALMATVEASVRVTSDATIPDGPVGPVGPAAPVVPAAPAEPAGPMIDVPDGHAPPAFGPYTFQALSSM